MNDLHIGGGGFSGIMFVGILEYLHENRLLDIKNFHGTSIGSLIGILYISGMKPKDIIKKTGDSVHFKTPISGNSVNGYVQTDFMFGDPTWMIWSMRGGQDKSEYKGMYRHVLLASIAKYKNFKWSY